MVHSFFFLRKSCELKKKSFLFFLDLRVSGPVAHSCPCGALFCLATSPLTFLALISFSFFHPWVFISLLWESVFSISCLHAHVRFDLFEVFVGIWKILNERQLLTVFPRTSRINYRLIKISPYRRRRYRAHKVFKALAISPVYVLTVESSDVVVVSRFFFLQEKVNRLWVVSTQYLWKERQTFKDKNKKSEKKVRKKVCFHWL